jgi:hypothetical protein
MSGGTFDSYSATLQANLSFEINGIYPPNRPAVLFYYDDDDDDDDGDMNG